MIHAIIVDDEELAIIYLEKKLQQFPNIQIVKTYTNHEHILSDLKKERIDVAFLDIEMAELNGLDLAEAIQSICPSIHVVFVTAHSEYAVQAFEINSIDYLLKPVTTNRLQKTMNRLIEMISDTDASPTKTTLKSPLIINCFRDFQVYHQEEPLIFKTAKVKELFAYLFTYMNTYIHRDILIEKLWPELEYRKSKINLHTSLSHLRKTLDRIGYPNCITFSNQSYSLSLDSVHCDAILFNNILHQLIVLNESNIAEAKIAIELYTGAYMELNGYEWAVEKSQEFHEKITSLLNRIINYFQPIDTNRALTYLQIHRKLNPYLDNTVKQSMDILIQNGNRAEAIKLYAEYEKLLLDDLGIKPDESLTSIYQSLFTTTK